MSRWLEYHRLESVRFWTVVRLHNETIHCRIQGLLLDEGTQCSIRGKWTIRCHHRPDYVRIRLDPYRLSFRFDFVGFVFDRRFVAVSLRSLGISSPTSLREGSWPIRYRSWRRMTQPKDRVLPWTERSLKWGRIVFLSFKRTISSLCGK